MARRRVRQRGWYVKEGDPAGTERFWDGEKWGPQPRQKKLSSDEKKKVAVAAAEIAGETTATPTFQQGTIWVRISARSMDMLLLTLPGYFLVSQAFAVQGSTNFLYLWGMVAMVMAYEVGFTATWGRTPGKRLMGLTVVDRDGGQSLGWGRAFFRATPLLLIVSILLIPVLWLVNVIAMFFDRTLQRSVFDFAGATVVVAAPRSR